MAILQEVDKCMRCNGCVIACKRTWKMKAETIGVHKVAYDQRLAIKSQKRVDMGPFVRFTCWHCASPPCASACPYKAIIKRDTGAVDVDETKCRPDLCLKNGQYPCMTGCQRGGYTKVGLGRDTQTAPKMNKCTLCYGKAGADVADMDQLASRSTDLTSKLVLPSGGTLPDAGVIPELEHEPACVMSCPAKAMHWDTAANIKAFLDDKQNGFWKEIELVGGGTAWSRRWLGGGSMFWASKNVDLAPPKADPLVEDHLAPMANDLSGSMSVVLPTLVIGGLAALSMRRSKIEEEESLSRGEV
jgi:formate dehydrogenase iron-sulfur subunit